MSPRINVFLVNFVVMSFTSNTSLCFLWLDTCIGARCCLRTCKAFVAYPARFSTYVQKCSPRKYFAKVMIKKAPLYQDFSLLLNQPFFKLSRVCCQVMSCQIFELGGILHTMPHYFLLDRN